MKYYNPELSLYQEFVQILDMNFLANPHAKQIIKSLKGLSTHYELVCGVDYRRMDAETAILLHDSGFIKIRWAWDYNFGQQRKHQQVLNWLVKAGYAPRDLSVFILANWKIPFVDCVRKLDLLKVWNVKVNDCCWDGGYKRAKPVYWTPEQIKKFRAMCRKHNQLVRFKIDPEAR
jgi:hypothetical protein